MTRYAKEQMIHDTAHAAGMEAGRANTPHPMTVVDKDRNKVYHVADGVCGFASVIIKPANSRFANFLRSIDKGYPAYRGGWTFPCHEFNQSLARKEEYCRAYAKVLRANGLDRIYCDSRMD